MSATSYSLTFTTDTGRRKISYKPRGDGTHRRIEYEADVNGWRELGSEIVRDVSVTATSKKRIES